MSTTEPTNPTLQDHPLRYALANELHARPFAALNAPCHALFLAIKRPVDAANRDRGADRAHLIELLDRYGAAHPQPDATHYFGDLGHHRLKWEQHTEFVTYTLFGDGVSGTPFDPAMFAAFPADWQARVPGKRLASALIRVEMMPEDASRIDASLDQWFVSESLAVSWVADRNALVAGDYRIDSAGHMRFAVMVENETSARRIGRIIQRLCEIEIYKTMSLLALPKARALSQRLAKLDGEVADLVAHVKGTERPAKDVLAELLGISAELEDLGAQNSFRFSATEAYAAIVAERIAAMREERYEGRQTFHQFMMRRFEPAMRTIRASITQLDQLTGRVKRAGELLRTRVEVARSEQNQALLASMDKRADLQLRLQKTVEGLSVVAISYYAVNLVAYLLAPAAKDAGYDKTALMAAATPVVLLLVWIVVRRIRKSMH